MLKKENVSSVPYNLVAVKSAFYFGFLSFFWPLSLFVTTNVRDVCSFSLERHVLCAFDAKYERRKAVITIAKISF